MPGGSERATAKVLIVEDDPAQRLTLGDILKDEGFSVTACDGIPSCLRHLEEHSPDVIVTDLRMPGMTETEWLERLDEAIDDVPVICHTGYGSFDTAKEAVNIGAFAYVEKVGDPGELVAHVRRALETRLRRRAEQLEAAVTERTRELRESENRYRALFESSRDAIMILAPPDWRFTAGNPATIEMFRAGSQDRFTSLGPWDLSPPRQPDGRDSHEKVREMIETAMRQGSHSFEWQHCRMDGEGFPAAVLLTRVDLREGSLVQATVRDITARKQAEQALVRHADLQRTVAEVAARFLRLPPDQADRGIDQGLAALAEFAGADRAYLFLFEEGDVMSNTHEWCGPEIAPQTGQLQHIAVDRELPWFADRIRRGKGLAITDISALPADARRERAHWADQDIRSLTVAPVFRGDALAGFVGLDAVRARRDWPDYIGGALAIAGTTFVHALDRQRAAEALGASERQLADLMRNLPGMAYRCRNDRDWTMEFVSEGSSALTGYRPDELVGGAVVSYGALIHPEDRSVVWDTIQAAVASGTRYEMEYRLRTREGQERWVWERGVAVGSDTRDPCLLEGFVGDITERKRAEEALRRSETRFRTLINSLTDLVLLYDLQGRILMANPAATKILGYSKEELRQMSVADLDPASVTRHDREAVWQELEPGQHVTLEVEIRRSDGSTFPAEVQVNRLALRGEQAVLGVGRDITERRRVERLREQQLRFRQTLINAIPVPVFYKDRDRRYLGVNQAFEEFFGMPTGQLVGKTVHEIAPEDLAAEYERKDRELLAHPGTQVYESKVTDTKGGVHEVIFHKATFEDEQGHLAGIIGAILDVTEQRELQKRWMQAQKMQAVGHLAGGIAHDFRNQLQIIAGFGSMLLDAEHIRPEGRAHMQEILAAAERSARLTGQLLAFSRQDMLRPELADPAELVRDLQKSLPRLLGEDIRLLVQPGHRTGRAYLDTAQFHQALINLCLNARDAMPGGGQVLLAVERTDLDETSVAEWEGARPGPYVAVSVADTGAGMDEETRHKAFEPFFTTKDVGKGTGLGLSMVYGFVTQSHGIITCQSTPGEGTEFRLYFPVADVRASADGDPDPPAPAPEGEGTILVVEDETGVRHMVSTMLRQAGYTVLQARDGPSALALLAEHDGDVDAIATDVVMPAMNGLVLAEKARAIRPDVRILYITGYMGDELVRRGLDDVAGQVLIKPFRPAQLLHAIADLLEP